jgi:hypothetical protein
MLTHRFLSRDLSAPTSTPRSAASLRGSFCGVLVALSVLAPIRCDIIKGLNSSQNFLIVDFFMSTVLASFRRVARYLSRWASRATIKKPREPTSIERSLGKVNLFRQSRTLATAITAPGASNGRCTPPRRQCRKPKYRDVRFEEATGGLRSHLDAVSHNVVISW